MRVYKGKGNEISFGPNPATEQIVFNTPCKIILNDMSGRQVANNDWGTVLDINNLPDGIYMLSAYDKSGERILHEKLLKK